MQELSPVDYDKRMLFSRWFLEQVIRDLSFVDASCRLPYVYASCLPEVSETSLDYACGRWF